MTITRLFNGGYSICAVIDGYLTTRRYFGYSKREAMRLFRSETS